MTFVIPGEYLGDVNKFSIGDGVYERENKFYACVAGERCVENVESGDDVRNNASSVSID